MGMTGAGYLFSIEGTEFSMTIWNDIGNKIPVEISVNNFGSDGSLAKRLSRECYRVNTLSRLGEGLVPVTGPWLATEFQPMGELSGIDYFKTASSPLNLAARFLRLNYQGDDSVCDVQPPIELINEIKLYYSQNA